MEYGLIGEKLSHSFSAEIHQMLGYDYILKELSPENVKDFFKERNFKGINVTIPYKKTVMNYLDYIDDTALKIGAVNTVCNVDGKLYGYNTDFYGMKALIEKTGVDLKGKTVLIAGSGGTSNTACYAAGVLGSEKIYRASRTEKEGFISYQTAKDLNPDFFINTTPCGMYPNENTESMDITVFKNLKGMVDAVYNPLKTVSVKKAENMGIPALSGLYMLVVQAVKASELFRNVKIAKTETEKIYQEILKQKSEVK